MSLRIAMLSVHTSPLHQPGTGDAGGMNVYMVELSRALAHEGARVDLFTRCLGEGHPPRVELAPGVDVLHLPAGPRRALPKEKMPELVPDFARALLAATARDHYDVLHSHYWLAGQAGTLVAERRNIPLVHTMHTLARVKNASLAPGDRPEPGPRVHGETALAASADRLIANTTEEARALRDLYGAQAERTDVVTPGINVRIFHPAGGRRAARARLGLPQDAFVPLFAGRVQPLKGPDILVHSIAALLRRSPRLRGRLLVPVIGGPSGAGARAPGELRELCARLGLLDVVRCRPATRQRELADWYRAADVLVMPSRSESFGLVALEAQACGTPVLAAAVDGPGHTGQLHPCVAGAGVRGGAGAAARPCPGGRFLPEVQKGRGTSLAFYLSGPKVLAHPKRMSGLISSIGRIKLLVAIPFGITRPGAVISAPWQVHDLRKHGLRVQRGRL